MKPFNRDFSIKMISLTIMMMALLSLTTPLALAQAGARVYLQPVSSDDSSLTVDVIAENVTEMYGAEFRLKYDPAVISVQDLKADQDGIQIETGTLLPAEKGFVVANEVNETEGTITFAMTLLNPAPAANGAGPLARVKFNILQASPSTITVEHAKLVAIDLQTIPSETGALTVGSDGQAETAAAPAAPNTPPTTGEGNFPWWIVAAIMIILGVLVIGGFVMMGGFNKKAAATPAQTPRPGAASVPGPQTARPTGSRPSAFKR